MPALERRRNGRVVEAERGGERGHVAPAEAILIGQAAREVGPGHRIRWHQMRPQRGEPLELLDRRRHGDTASSGERGQERALLRRDHVLADRRSGGVLSLQRQACGLALDGEQRRAGTPSRQPAEQLPAGQRTRRPVHHIDPFIT